MSRLEDSSSIRVFVVSTNTAVDLQKLQPDVVQWPIPSLTHLASTRLGATDFNLYFSGPPPPPGAKPVRLEDKYDALLYLGPPSTITMVPLSPSLCADPAYVNMRLLRIGLFPQLKVLADRFKQACARAAQ